MFIQKADYKLDLHCVAPWDPCRDAVLSVRALKHISSSHSVGKSKTEGSYEPVTDHRRKQHGSLSHAQQQEAKNFILKIFKMFCISLFLIFCEQAVCDS